MSATDSRFPGPVTVSDLIDLWPSLGSFAAEVGISYESAKAMRRRRSIDARYWVDLVAAAARRSLPVDHELLARLHARQSRDSNAEVSPCPAA